MSKLETDSDSSEEFFDAEDTTPNNNRHSTLGRNKLPAQEFIFPEPAVRVNAAASSDSDATPIGANTPATRSPTNSLGARFKQQDVVDSSNASCTAPAHVFVEPKPVKGVSGRQRFQELRQCMQNDEDDNPGNTLTPDSQNSSMDGVFTNRPTHPFKVIESDTMSIQSMTSLGRVGRILAGSIDPSAISVDRESLASMNAQQQQLQSQQQQQHQLQRQTPPPTTTTSTSSTTAPTTNAIAAGTAKQQTQAVNAASSSSAASAAAAAAGVTAARITAADSATIMLQEPDVIASTKLTQSKTTDSITSSGPVAPPRTKKKSRKLSSSSSEQFNTNDGMRLPPGDAEDTDSDTRSVKSVRDVQQKLRDDIVKQFESSLNDVSAKASNITLTCSSTSTIVSASASTTTTPSSLAQIAAVSHASSTVMQVRSVKPSHSLGNSVTSVYSKPSPSNSAKSNSAPGRVSSIDPNQGLNLFKAIQGGYVVKPRDEASNKAQGPSQDEIERIEKMLMESASRPKLAGSGSNSLGSATRYTALYRGMNDKERRKSAGDEDVLRQMNIYVRTRTNSGKQLTDFEILEQVPVKNLDTGENMPLSEVRSPPVPEGWNPLSLHILKLTSHLEVIQKESDEESVIGIPPSIEGQPPDEDELETEDGSRLKKKTARLKRFFGSTMRKTVDKAKSIASEVSHARHKEDVADIVDAMNPEQNIKIKASSSNKGPYEFTKLQHVQDLSGEDTSAVWCMKFSSCGRLLATAGQDKVLRIWVLKDAYPYFQDMRNKYNADQKSSPTPSQESLVSQHSAEEAIAMATAAEKCTGPFMPKPFCTYVGHTSDLLDVSWSKNYFILSSSMDKTVRLWHISRKECLCCFQHIDFVTAIAFHPRDDRYFLSGSLDGKLRLWNIPDKKVALWNEVDGQTKLITAANFCQNGQFAVVGSYDGRCIFYNTDQLKYHTQIHVRSTRGKNRIGRKISGIEPMPGEDKILVTSNDSRVRLYDLRDLNLSCKYKGYLNVSSQIKGSFSHDGKYIIAGSENQCIYIWKTNHDYSKLSSVRRDRSDFWEGIKAHNATVTCAIFAPHPEAIIKPEPDEVSNDKLPNNQPDPLVEQHKKGCGYVLVSADFNGAIKVFINKTKPKHSSLPYTAIAD
ncbi:WD repeat-containing protein 44 isoform X1 [Drosophila sulfurigaster albostrigata]|uniref:WD repeat-containing protein 44 isoform X1 n=1 Tax=Drosophila sulfurigaster albostrigata TaxID=89887 RepID=UPI002D21BAC6|nr:WD repeat-containing protein 44 isoform X1 [Drosophila sulfurigaster albostrigata]